MRVLVFGASITQGFWDTEGGWVARLRKHYDMLQMEGLKSDQPTVFNLGISGDTTKRILKRLKNETEARTWPGENFTFVFSIGTNNAIIKNGRNSSEVTDYEMDLDEIIKIAKQFSNKIMFVGLSACDEIKTSPVSWANVTYTNERILLFDKVARKICAEHSIKHIPIFEAFEAELAKGKTILADGLHPNNEGHQLIFKLVRPELDKLLNT